MWSVPRGGRQAGFGLRRGFCLRQCHRGPDGGQAVAPRHPPVGLFPRRPPSCSDRFSGALWLWEPVVQAGAGGASQPSHSRRLVGGRGLRLRPCHGHGTAPYRPPTPGEEVKPESRRTWFDRSGWKTTLPRRGGASIFWFVKPGHAMARCKARAGAPRLPEPTHAGSPRGRAMDCAGARAVPGGSPLACGIHHPPSRTGSVGDPPPQAGFRAPPAPCFAR